MPQSRNTTVRLRPDDYQRIREYAKADGMRLGDFIRHLMSVGLRAEDLPPLEPVPYCGRPMRKGRKSNVRATHTTTA